MWNTELLCTRCRGIGPHLVAREKSHGFSQVAVCTCGIFSMYGRDDPSKLVFDQRRQDSCLVLSEKSGISSRLCRAVRMLHEVRLETKNTFLVATVILGFLSIFIKSQALSPFEALNSASLSRCQRDVRPTVQMKRAPRAFSKFSTGDSDIPSSCEIKQEPEFKPMQGNPAFF